MANFLQMEISMLVLNVFHQTGKKILKTDTY